MKDENKLNDADRQVLPLLAGWLDGELTAADAQRVEAALERSAELRAVLEEWRSVDQVMQQSEPVRSEAEWEALALRVEDAIAVETDRDAPGSQEKLPTHNAPGWFDRCWTWFGNRRWAVGGSGAIAAAVLLVVLWPNSEQLLNQPGVRETELPPTEAPLQTSPQAASPSVGVIAESKKTSEQTAVLDESSKAEKADEAKAMNIPKAVARSKDQGGKTQELPQLDTNAPAPAATSEASAVASDAFQTEADEKVTGRARRSSEVEARVESVEEESPKETSAPQAADSQARSTSRQIATAPSSAKDANIRRSPEKIDADDSWMTQLNTQLDNAVAAQNQNDLRGIIAEIDRRRSAAAAAAADETDVIVVGFAVRARSESLRLFPEAPENVNACVAIRSDYDEWLRLASQEIKDSPDGRRVRSAVDAACAD